MTADRDRRIDAAQEAPPAQPEAPATTPEAILDDDFLSPEHVLPNVPHIPEPDLTEEVGPEAAAPPVLEDVPEIELPGSWELETTEVPPAAEASAEAPVAADDAGSGGEPPAEAIPLAAAPMAPAFAEPPADPPQAAPPPAAAAPDPPGQPAPPAAPAPEAPAPTEPQAPPARPQIPVAPAPARAELVLDTTAGRFLVRGGEIHAVDEAVALARWRLWVADTRDTMGPGAVRVDAPPKYAPLLARRVLARGGEVDETTTLRPLSRKRLGPNQTLLGFHLLTTAEEARLTRLHQRSPHGLLLHDASTLLLGLLRHHSGTVAGILQLPGTLTALVVRGGQVLWGRRQMLADDQGPAWEAAVRALRADLDLAGREAGFEIDSTLWIAGLTPTRDLPLDGALALPVCGLTGEAGTWYSALPLELGHLHHGASLTPAVERLAAALRPWEPLAWAAVLVLGLLAVGGGLLLQNTAADLAIQAEAHAARKARLLQELAQAKADAEFPDDLQRQAQGALATAQAILRAEAAPPLAGVWNDLARLKPAACRITTLEMAYDGPSLRLSLTGGLELPMTQAQAVFDAFQRDLTAAGYAVAAADLRFDLDGNAYSLTLTRSFAP